MKKIYVSTLFIISAFIAKGITHNVSVGDFYFNPQNVSAQCGDTIKWIWENGTHSTTSDSTPSCATGWDHDITATSTSFFYVIPLTCAGVYSYHCKYHPTMMMGTITAVLSGIGEISGVKSSIYPNPFSESITVVSSNVTKVSLVDLLGNVVKEVVAEPNQPKIVLDVADLPKGIYFIRLFRDGAVLATKKMNKI